MHIAIWRRGRQVVQALSLLFFTLLVVYTWRDVQGILAADDLMRLDPLAGLGAMLAARRWLVRFVPALVLLGATLILGRFWCGWLCPLGTLIDWTSRDASRDRPLPKHWHGVKYGLLFIVLFAALWGNLTLMILDPLTIFIRALGTVILPGLHGLITQAERFLYRVPALWGPVDAVDALLRGPILSAEQPLYIGTLLTSAMFGGVLALNWITQRAWCRYFCPLGGLLSLVSRASWLKRKRSAACAYCGACEEPCRMGAIDINSAHGVDSGECVLCLDCAVGCAQGAVSFGGDWHIERGQPYDPTRRQALGALGISLGGLALLKVPPAAEQPDPYRLRPPGAEEKHLLSTCMRCGACLRACPSHGLQPSLTEAGIEGLATPILVPRLGHCDYACTACGEICPTGAIPALPLEEKRRTVIGKAYIDPRTCIAWSERGPCIVCEEMCPIPDKAIKLIEKEAQDAQGKTYILQLPVVKHELCIGCGLCEAKCPVIGKAAIRVILDPMASPAAYR